MKICQNCKRSFTIEAEDFAFYRKMEVPPPTWCPECRFVRRLISRNERTLYKRPCALCGADKIMIFSKDNPYTAYCFQCWWSDKWDAMDYGRDYDFSRPFFDQFRELMKAVPRPGIIQQGFNVNSEYTNRASDNKNCYLIFAAANNEDCSYGVDFWDSLDCMDCYDVKKCERCYECIDCFGCSNMNYSQECSSCSSGTFLFNCRNCQDCFGCVNLRNKNYCFLNEQLTREQYRERVSKINFGSREVAAKMRALFEEEKKKYIVPAMMEYKTVDTTGNWNEECKNVRDAFACADVEDGGCLFGIGHAKDVMDYSYWGMYSERMYESSNVGRQCADIKFCNECWDQLLRAEYCMNCHSSQDLFGCIGLRKKQFCILNKQYSEEEYLAMVPKIKKQMTAMPYTDAKGRVYAYGEYFPPDIFPFAYNEVIAQEYFPIDRARADELGFPWKDADEKSHTVTIKPGMVPDDIKDVSDSVMGEVVGCTHESRCNHQCTAAFRIIPQELQFYRAHGIPFPVLCPNCRHYERLGKRLPMKLWRRKCGCNNLTHPLLGKERGGEVYKNTAKHFHGEGQCPNAFETSYATDSPAIVYCLQCYSAEMS